MLPVPDRGDTTTMTAATIADRDRLAALGELAAGAAHDINNATFAILGLTDFLLADTEPGTKAHERLLLIQQSGLEIKDIVKGLQDFARGRELAA
jgi:two-component system, cell cycle sensor histidine kinase and response regulator CckA